MIIMGRWEEDFSYRLKDIRLFLVIGLIAIPFAVILMWLMLPTTEMLLAILPYAIIFWIIDFLLLLFIRFGIRKLS